MKLFIAKGYHLASLAVPAKLVYSIFLLFILLGLWSSAILYSDRIGAATQSPAGQPSVQERYVNRAKEAAPRPTAGPALDLGDEPPAAAPAPVPAEDPKRAWVLDVFHQHLFSVSVVFLILAHLFMLLRLHPAFAGSVVLLSGVSALAHVLAPVIIWKTGGWLWLMPVTGAAMALTWTLMVLWSLVAMWFGAPAREDRGATP
ncbi:MAG: hypothetical protein HY902_18835 [Deltaproteobacteria bacterium]|nr:hypothetical protein [Deltaproteobacteria bacterium]